MTLVEDKFKETSSLLWEYKAILEVAIRYTNVKNINTTSFTNNFYKDPLKWLVWFEEKYFGEWTLHLKGEEYEKVCEIKDLIANLYLRMPDFEYTRSLKKLSEESVPAYHLKYNEYAEHMIEKFNIA